MNHPQLTFESNRAVLISDLHVDADLHHVERDTNMADNLARAVAAIVCLIPRPACVLINGDVAHWHGHPEDYLAAAALLKPIGDTGIPMHFGVGNHDHRENLWKVFPQAVQMTRPVPERQISLIELPLVDWYMLDSLLETNGVPGLIGSTQLDWLARNLDVRANRPAIIMSHHQPDLNPTIKGLIDTPALLDVISPRRQVKALIYGHTHRWVHTEQSNGMHWVNIPATGYVFYPEQPSGWVDVRVSDRGASLQLNCLNEAHPSHRQTLWLNWR